MIKPNETEMIGSWQVENGRVQEDAVCQRIRSLTANELEQVAVSQDGWEKLYRDRADGRYWECFYPQSESHGGGPPALRVIKAEVAKQKYLPNDQRRELAE